VIGTGKHVRFFDFLWPRSGAGWALVGGPVARRGWGDRALFAAVGRGSESYRFRESVDAQTCCPLSAFTFVATEHEVSPPACQILDPRATGGNGPNRPSAHRRRSPCARSCCLANPQVGG
jgi:hypothetical protein